MELSKTDEVLIETGRGPDFARALYGNKIEKLDIGKLVEPAYQFGYEYVKQINPEKKAAENAYSLGIKGISWIEGSHQWRQHTGVSDTISIGKKTLQEALEALTFFNIHCFTGEDIYEICIWHELFHYIEENIGAMTDSYFNKPDNPLLRDFAAFGFTNAITMNRPCEMIEFLFLKYKILSITPKIHPVISVK